MSYPKRLLRLKPRRGISADLPAYEIPPEFFTGGRNVLFRNGLAGRVLGSRDAYMTAMTLAAPTQLVHARNTVDSGTNYWLVFEPDGSAWALEGDNATQIDAGLLTAVGEPYKHISTSLNGIPVYSNGSDEPVYWDGSVLQTLPGWTATESCQFIAAFKFHLFALNISGPGGTFPNLLKWSAAAAPGSVPGDWTPGPGDDAGSVELSDSPGELVCAYPLQDGLAIYKKSAMYFAQYIGGNEVFAFRKLRNAVGALAPRAVCDVDGRHLVVSDGDIVITDGTNKTSIGESRMKDYFFNQIDQDNFRNLFCTFNRSRNEVLIGFPTQGNVLCNQGLTYNVAQDSFGLVDLDNVADAAMGYVNDEQESNVWEDRNEVWADALDVWGASALSAARDSLVHVRSSGLRVQDTPTSEVVPATLTREGITFDAPERVKFVKRVHILKSSNSGDLLVRVGAKMTPGDSETFTPEVLLPAGEQIVNLTAAGRYFSVQVRSNDSALWAVAGMELEAELRGYH